MRVVGSNQPPGQKIRVGRQLPVATSNVLPNNAAMPSSTSKNTLPRETYRNLIRVQERLASNFTCLFREYGLSSAQYNIMRVLDEAPPEGAPCQYISSQLLTKVPDVTRLIDRMVALDLVRRERSERDRRIVIVHLTTKGEDIYQRLESPVADVYKAQFSQLSQEQVQRLNSSLLQILTGTDAKMSAGLETAGPKDK